MAGSAPTLDLGCIPPGAVDLAVALHVAIPWAAKPNRPILGKQAWKTGNAIDKSTGRSVGGMAGLRQV